MAEELGTLLRGMRDRAGVSRDQLAARAKIAPKTLQRLETDPAYNPKKQTVALVVEALIAEPALTDAERDRLRAAAGAAAGPVPAPRAAADDDEEPALPPLPPLSGELAEAAERLAVDLRVRWQTEEKLREVRDPVPLPIRWREAGELSDHRANILQLPGTADDRDVDLASPHGLAAAYRRIPSGRLAVLGRAGSGKSILALRLALDLLAPHDPTARIPVLFTVGSWDPSTTDLRDWLARRLLRDHPHLARRTARGTTLAAELLDRERVLPVLDGFDEIAAGLRGKALKQLNDASDLPLVLTARQDEFRAAAPPGARAPLHLAPVLELTDLTVDDLAGYLPRTARRADDGRNAVWDAVLEQLRAGRTPAARTLAAVLTTPLMTVLARTLYSEAADRDPAELLDTARFPTAAELEQHLLAGFVPARYPEAEAQRAERRLGFLAHAVAARGRDREELAWWRLPGAVHPLARTLVTAAAAAVCMAAAVFLVEIGLPWAPLREVLFETALLGPIAGVSFGSVHLLYTRNGRLFPPSSVRLRWRPAHRRPPRTVVLGIGGGTLGGALMGIGCGGALALEQGQVAGIPAGRGSELAAALVNMAGLALTFGLAGGLVLGVATVFAVPVDLDSAPGPVEVLAANRVTARRQFLVLAPLFGAAIALAGFAVAAAFHRLFGPLAWPPAVAVVSGAIGGLGGTLCYVLAFTAWGQWLLFARIWLPLTRRLPRNPVAFLEDACARGVLRPVGSVHRFRHERLRRHLGERYVSGSSSGSANASRRNAS